VKLLSDYLNACDHNPSTLRTDGRTDNLPPQYRALRRSIARKKCQDYLHFLTANGRSYSSYRDIGLACKQNILLILYHCCQISRTMGIVSKLIDVVIVILSLTMGFFFMFVGCMKLTPALNEDTHEELVSSARTQSPVRLPTMRQHG